MPTMRELWFITKSIRMVSPCRKSTGILNDDSRSQRQVKSPAPKLCKDICCGAASGKDFFVQQERNGETICGIFKNKLDSESEYVQHGRHIYGTVCHEPGQVLTYKADEDRLKDNLTRMMHVAARAPPVNAIRCH